MPADDPLLQQEGPAQQIGYRNDFNALAAHQAEDWMLHGITRRVLQCQLRLEVIERRGRTDGIQLHPCRKQPAKDILPLLDK